MTNYWAQTIRSIDPQPDVTRGVTPASALPRFCAAAVLAVCGAVLVAWLQRADAGWLLAMRVDAALAFALIAIAVLASSYAERATARIVVTLAVAAAMVGATALARYAIGLDAPTAAVGMSPRVREWR